MQTFSHLLNANMKQSTAEQVTSAEQQAVQVLAVARDTRQRCAIDVATQKNREELESQMLYFTRYNAAQGTKVHESETCIIILAEDVKSPNNARFALKLMANEDEWQREKETRLHGDRKELGLHILDIIDSFVDEKARASSQQSPFAHVMQAAGCLLDDFLSYSRAAGMDLGFVTALMLQIGQHLQYMHVNLKCCHGDLKPRNIVKIVVEGKEQYILIDLDASCTFGMLAGQKSWFADLLADLLAIC